MIDTSGREQLADDRTMAASRAWCSTSLLVAVLLAPTDCFSSMYLTRISGSRSSTTTVMRPTSGMAACTRPASSGGDSSTRSLATSAPWSRWQDGDWRALVPGLPAEVAGLRVGDALVSVDGVSNDDLQVSVVSALIARHSGGET